MSARQTCRDAEDEVRDLRRWNVRVVREALADGGAFMPFPPAGDRVAVEAVRGRLGEAAVAALLARARVDLSAPIPALPAELYLDFQWTGRREPYEDAQRQRRNMLYRLALADYLEGGAEFTGAVENLLWARLEETNWAWPAHARTLDFPDFPTLDLAAAMSGLDLAEIDHLLGTRLGEALRARLRSEVQRRVVTPFLTRHDHWWLHATPGRRVNNWTAVCVAGAVGAACYLETDETRLAEIIARGLASLADYLETFDPQGGSSEGPDYWSYGFGNFAVLGHLIAARTAGRIDLLDDGFVREIACFPLRTVLAPGLWASFSDSDANPQFPPGLLSYLADRLDLPELAELGICNSFVVEGFNQFIWPLRQYAWPLRPQGERFTGTNHDWYADLAWMISRLEPKDPGSLRLAIKGGHNAEMHNHNDIGAMIVVAGGKVLITDPGRGRYSKSYFGPDRYRNLMASSRGHSVPVVNGHEQVEGAEHRAGVVDHGHGTEADWLVLDLTAAYPESAGAKTIERRVRFDRTWPGGRIELVDTFTFRAAPGRFQSVLITAAQVRIEQGTVHISDGAAALVVAFDPGQADVSIEVHPGVEKQYAPSVDLTRIVFSGTQALSGTIALTITPMKDMA